MSNNPYLPAQSPADVDMNLANSTDSSEEPHKLATLVSLEELNSWRHPNQAHLLRDLSLIWIQIILGLTAYLAFPHPSTFLIALFIISCGQVGLGVATHEFVHYLVLPKHRQCNDLTGRWLFAAPLIVPYEIYRQSHFTHHRLVSTEGDTKRLYRRNYCGINFARELLNGVSGVDYFSRITSMLRYTASNGMRLKPCALAQDSIAIIIMQILIASGFIWVGSLTLYFSLWLLPIITSFSLLGKLRTTVEHHPLACESGQNPEGPFYKGTTTSFSRSVRASWWERFMFSPLNFHYHAEHHLWPSFSYQFLPIIHNRLRANGAFKLESRIAEAENYRIVLKRLWRGE